MVPDALIERIARGVRAFASRNGGVTEIGAFQAVIDKNLDLPWLNGAWPRLPDPDDQTLVATSLRDLRAHFSAARRKLRFEYFEALHPRLGTTLEEAGFIRKSRQPIMTCGRNGLSAAGRPGIRIEALAATAPQALFEDFATTRDRGFGDQAVKSHADADAAIEALRRDIRSGLVMACLAFLNDRPAGVGSLQAIDGICELAGIATLPECRRRAVATEVSAWLARAHFDADGELAWLTAGNADAESVYRRIGFRETGAYQLTYEEA